MLTRQSYGLDSDGAFLAVSEHGHAYRFEASTAGGTTLYEARELVGAEVLPSLSGQVDAVRLDLAHQPADAVEAIVGAYSAALDALREQSQSGSGEAVGAVEAPPGASPTPWQEAVQVAREVHSRHAPHGLCFTGHLVRGSRALDAVG